MKLEKSTTYNLTFDQKEMEAIVKSLGYIEFNCCEEQVGITYEQFELITLLVRRLRDEV